MRRRKDPRVIVLATATLAVVAGVTVGLVARWPLAGVVLAFVIAATLAAVYAAPGASEFRNGTLRAFSATFRRRVGGRTAGEPTSPSESEGSDTSAERLLHEAGLLADDASERGSSAPLSAAGDIAERLSSDRGVQSRDTAEAAAADRTSSEDTDSLPRLARDFESAWRRRIVEMDGREGDTAALASLLQVPEEDVELEWDPAESALVAFVRGERAGNWPSRAAFVADVTAVAEFRSAFPKWWSLSPSMRTRVLAALRLCLDWCPVCDGSLRIDRRPARTGDVDETRRISSANRNASRSGDADGRRPSGRRGSLGDAIVLASTCQACGADVFAAEIADGRVDPQSRHADADIEL
ncbi:hypothetical protein SAMN05216278_1157 [Halopelagius longus]|nr:hypothetical protein SAMN05216278_1157 [Halopelagius longus]